MINSKFILLFCFLYPLCIKAQTWSLQDCIEHSINNNLEIKKNEIEEKIKLKDLEINKRERLPSLNAYNSSIVTFGQQQDVFGNNKRNDNLNSSTSISSEVTIFNNKLIDKNVKKSKLELESVSYKIENEKQQLLIRVIEAYLSVLINKEIESVNDVNASYALDIYKRVEKSFKVGKSSKKELSESEAEYIKEKFNHTKAKLETKKTLLQLAQILQINFSENFDVLPFNDEINPSLINTKEAIEEVKLINPGINMARLNINIEELNKSIIKTRQYPTLSLTAGLGTFFFNSFVKNANNANYFKQNMDNFTQNIGLNLSIPIYNKGIIKSQILQSQLNKEYAEESFKQQVLSAENELNNIFLNLETYYQTYLASKELQESSKTAYNYGLKSFNAGVSTIYDLNILRNNLKQSESEVIKAKYSYVFNTELINVLLNKYK